MSDNHQFAKQWSPAIEKHGYTSVPNLLLIYRTEFDITVSEFVTFHALDSFRWDGRKPYPSAATISKRAGQSVSTVRTNLRKLEAKDIIVRQHRKNNSSKFDFDPIIMKLDRKAVSTKPPTKKQPPTLSETQTFGYQNPATKEDSLNNTKEQDPTNKKEGLVGVGEMLLEHPLRKKGV